MAIYDSLPYTNFHELNADWLLKQMKEAKAKIDEYQEVLDQFEEDYNVLLGLAAAMTVAGSNVTVAGSLTANGLIGNLTGNVTGNLNGNAATATYATSAGSATTATSATNATNAVNATNATNASHATTADSATTATSATSATSAYSASLATNADFATEAGLSTEALTLQYNTDVTGTDMNDYVDNTLPFALFKAVGVTTNLPGTITSGRSAVVLSVEAPSGAIMQFAWYYRESLDIFFRVKFGGAWQSWRKISAV